MSNCATLAARCAEGYFMETTITWVDNVQFQAESDSGHNVVIDGPADLGGQNKGLRPMEMLLAGMGACTALDVVTILKKSRQRISGCRAQLSANRADTPPQVFTNIHVHFVLAGHELKHHHVERAIQLSAEKYCSASIMLGKTARITHDFEIEETLP